MNAGKVRNLVISSLLTLTLSACSGAYSTKVIKDDKSYGFASLYVLSNTTEDFSICTSEFHSSETNTEYKWHYGYTPGMNINGEISYEYEYKYGPVTETTTYYKYVDIENNNETANDKNMQGYGKRSLTEFYETDEYKEMNGSIEYNKVKQRVKERIQEERKKYRN